jgi:metal-dependent HD superfamily phosphatase/phosphodiesterase
VVAQYHLPAEEAEVVVVLAAALHDVGLAVYPGEPWQALAALAGPKARELLAPLYPPRERTILVSEVQQAVAGHHRGACLTLEAGALHLADALDIAEGRLQAAPGRERHAADTPPARVEAVAIKKGAQCPVRVDIRLGQSGGADEVRRLLARTLQAAALDDAVQVVGRHNGRVEFTQGLNSGSDDS